MPLRLTETAIKRLPRGAHRDTVLKGFLVVVNKNSASYCVQRDLFSLGRPRTLVKTVRHTLGRTDEITLDDARTSAMLVIAQIKRGIDPNAQGEEAAAGGWTLHQLWVAFAEDLAQRECRERTVEDFQAIGRRYLADLMALPLANLKRSTCRDRHKYITKHNGPVAANRTFRAVRAAYNFALRTVDDPDALPSNPVVAVTFNKEVSSDVVLLPDALKGWHERVRALPNPLRSAMFLLGLLSGLRPGNLAAIRRADIDLPNHTILIPRTKSGRAFSLPLSEPMEACVTRALAAGDLLFPGSPFLFTTRNRAGQMVATQEWRVQGLMTGHVLRHSYRTFAHAAGVSATDVQLLMDHRVPGITGVYLHDHALFGHLRTVQERISAYLVALLG